jgi:hypothetical protein
LYNPFVDGRSHEERGRTPSPGFFSHLYPWDDPPIFVVYNPQKSSLYQRYITVLLHLVDPWPQIFSCGKPLVTLHSENLRTRPWDFITYSASVLQLVLMVLDGVVMGFGWFWGEDIRRRMGV